MDQTPEKNLPTVRLHAQASLGGACETEGVRVGSVGSGSEGTCRLVPCLREGDGVVLECIGWMNGQSKLSTLTGVVVQWRMRTSRMTVRQA